MCGVLGMSYSEDPRNPAWTWPGRGRSGCLSLDCHPTTQTHISSRKWLDRSVEKTEREKKREAQRDICPYHQEEWRQNMKEDIFLY